MFAASTYDEIIEYERLIENQEIVVLLFVKPTSQDAVDIIREFEYIHYNSSYQRPLLTMQKSSSVMDLFLDPL